MHPENQHYQLTRLIREMLFILVKKSPLLFTQDERKTIFHLAVRFGVLSPFSEWGQHGQ